MADAKPYPKSQQLARGERRYRRKVASPKQWQAIRAAKLDGQTCRISDDRRAEVLHHLVKRSHGGDDVADNLVPLCEVCHGIIHAAHGSPTAQYLLERLSDAEYAYMIERGGEDYPERAYGISYER